MRNGIVGLTCLISCLLLGAAAALAPATPAELYGELFERVQLAQIYPDSKSFVDALPNRPPEQVLAEYRQLRARDDFDLRAFVAQRFAAPAYAAPPYRIAAGREDVRAYIDRLWGALERKPDSARLYSSRLPLPERYVVPGGRFDEIYYWDSYFTMLGLEQSGRHDLTLAMLGNFAWLIGQFGHIPNGNRSYYLSRSQPPFFAAMVALAAARDGESLYGKFLPQLRAEYAFWMEGAASLAPGEAHRRVVRMPDGAVLNRYWDDRDTPREEAYKEDVATARASGRSAAEVYRNLRAAAESGWDFSSRWLGDGKTLATIRTVELIPPDLNSLLYQLELTIAKGCALVADASCVRELESAARARKAAVTRFLWNPRARAFTDFAWREGKRGTQVTAATLYPLYVQLADDAQARAVAASVRSSLLQRFGLATTSVRTGQQWDAPNGWAPLQWIAIQGLKNYGHARLASLIAQRWVTKNLQVYRRTGTLLEKYDVAGSRGGGGGGEYPLQEGFGWTNGVLRQLLETGAVARDSALEDRRQERQQDRQQDRQK
jgi:alpha,alpha-trehalase